MRRAFYLGLLWLLLLPSLAFGGEKWALIIGVEKYKGPIEQVFFAENDARELAKVLKEIGGFQKVVLLTTADEKEHEKVPTRTNIIRWLDELGTESERKEVSLFIFFFAGHGMEEEKEEACFLLPYDADRRTLTLLRATCIDLKYLRSLLEKIKAEAILAFFDCCRTEPGRGSEPNPLTENFARDIVIRPRRETIVSGTYLACKLGERAYAWEKKKHGFFTYFLLEGLKGGAVNDEGIVTPASLGEFLTREVPPAVKREKRMKQEPWPRLEGPGQWTFEIGRPPLPPEVVPTEVNLSISTEPPGAKVFIEGKFVGVSPLDYVYDLGDIKEKTVTVRLEREGYRPRTLRVALMRGRPAEVKEKLEPEPVYLAIISHPEGAEVILNGEPTGKATPVTILIPPGEYEIVLRKEGFEEVKEKLLLKIGEGTKYLKFELLPGTVLVEVQTVPPGAEIFVGEEEKARGKAPCKIPLPVGEHLIRVRKEGYHEGREKISVSLAEPLPPLVIKLEPLSATVRVESTPPGAEILVDGKGTGRKTPSDLPLPPGEHEISFKLEGYKEQIKRIKVGPGEKSSLLVKLEPLLSGVTVETVPQGAEIFFDGDREPRGRSPLTVQLPPGKYTVRVVMKGYEEARKDFEVKPGSLLPIKLELSPLPSILKISSEPAGAEVWIDERKAGVTGGQPLEVKVGHGKHVLLLRKEGFSERRIEIEVSPGEVREVREQLPPLGKGSISVNSIPMGAEVYLDGKKVGETPTIIKDVLAGRHVLEFKLEGYKPKRVEVEVRLNETVYKSVTLEPEK